MHIRYRQRGRSLWAFTLTELIVTVGILALLAILGMSAVEKIRKRSSSVKCLANLRQLSLGTGLYLIDHSQTYWPHTFNGDQGWYAQLKGGPVRGPLAYLDYDVARGDLTRKGGVMDCPDMKTGHGGLVLDYMYNGGLGDASPLKASQIIHPERKILFMTGYIYRFRWPQATHPLSPLASSLNPSIKTYGAFVHGDERANIVFVDGHCEALTEREIAQRGVSDLSDPLYWSQ